MPVPLINHREVRRACGRRDALSTSRTGRVDQPLALVHAADRLRAVPRSPFADSGYAAARENSKFSWLRAPATNQRVVPVSPFSFHPARIQQAVHRAFARLHVASLRDAGALPIVAHLFPAMSRRSRWAGTVRDDRQRAELRRGKRLPPAEIEVNDSPFSLRLAASPSNISSSHWRRAPASRDVARIVRGQVSDHGLNRQHVGQSVSRSCSRYRGVWSSGKALRSCWAVQAAVGWSVTATWTIRRRSCARMTSTNNSR